MPSSLTNIIDSHQHFWQLSRGDYDWLTPSLDKLYQDFLPANYRQITSGKVSQTVLVQAAATEQETQFMFQLADQHPFIAGVVGWVDMEQAASQVCQRLEEFSQHKAFKGIRPMLQDIDDVDWILNPAFKSIFEHLVKLNLTFDALVHTAHLENIYFLASRHPKLNIVIDHCAKPNISKQQFDLWAERIAMFESTSNVFVKISGLPTEASANQQQAEHFKSYFEHIYRIFGANRMMWGSDWPVVNINSSFNSWLAISKELSIELSSAEQQDLFVNTAQRFYSLTN